MPSGIYKITNQTNGHFYIGQTFDLERRISQHFRTLQNKNHRNRHLQNAFNKYGVDCFRFDILLVCEQFELTRYEQIIVSKYKPEYNIRKDCVDSNKGVIWSEESKKRKSDSQFGENNINYGKHHSEETKRKIGSAQVGSKNHNYGKRHTEEEKAAMSLLHIGHPVSEETKKKMSDSGKLGWIKRKQRENYENRPA